MDLPVPGPSIIVNHRMPVYAPDCERAPVCETRPTIVYNYPYRYTYHWHHGRPEWKRHNWGGNHRRNDTAPQYYGYYDSDRGYRNDRDCDRDYDRRHDGRRY
jgi:hypothetical protein